VAQRRRPLIVPARFGRRWRFAFGGWPRQQPRRIASIVVAEWRITCRTVDPPRSFSTSVSKKLLLMTARLPLAFREADVAREVNKIADRFDFELRAVEADDHALQHANSHSRKTGATLPKDIPRPRAGGSALSRAARRHHGRLMPQSLISYARLRCCCHSGSWVGRGVGRPAAIGYLNRGSE
jgi:hypothetical protein